MLSYFFHTFCFQHSFKREKSTGCATTAFVAVRLTTKIRTSTMNRISRIFQPLNIVPKNAVVKTQDITSKSQKV